jgi:UDP-GlcNAc:undecaprenyl-phosphate GlcNAc-1-phosphate transferase
MKRNATDGLFTKPSILALGIYDDIKGANARKKLTVQTIAAVALFYFGFEIRSVSNPFGGSIHLGWLR